MSELIDLIRRTVLVALGGNEGDAVRQLVVDGNNALWVRPTGAGATPATPPTPAAYTFPSSGALPNSSAWLLGPTITVGAQQIVTFGATYTGGGATAQAGYEVLVGYADPPDRPLPIYESSIGVSGTTGSRNAYDDAIALPVTGTSAYKFAVAVDVRGWPYVALRVRELVKDTTNGVVSLAQAGGSY